jgi:hypothetical protein
MGRNGDETLRSIRFDIDAIADDSRLPLPIHGCNG